ncbi:MAG: hypothetical protein HFH77_00405 [Lachnospiraceae bacterium]|nr:hypothetical protein [Lachnospiraceae bacterium]
MTGHFCTGKNDYEIVREVLTGKANDVYVCRSCKEPAASRRTVWLVKDRRIAKSLAGNMGDLCEEIFMQGEKAGFVFPYVQERPLLRHYLGTIQGAGCIRRRIWLGLAARCITSGIPDAVLNLMLNQGQVNIQADGTVWFGFFVDLSEYNHSACGQDNVTDCARLFMELIRLEYGAGQVSAFSAQAAVLLEKKLVRKEYHDGIQLYRDIKLISRLDEAREKKVSVLGKIAALKKFLASKQDRIYSMLSCGCIVLVCIVIALAVGRLLFGTFSFWKLFGSPLERIGTESLLQ